jgi:vacuolar-type H+-ATPase subunit F/Vma7
MARIGVLGGSEFIVGFQLAGIRDTFEVSDNPLEDIAKIREEDISVVIIDEGILHKLDEHERLKIEDSINPVFIPLSTEGTQESLRRLIRKSIGIDLWKGG